MTVGHAMSFAKLRERVRGRVRVHACVHVRGGIAGRKTRRVGAEEGRGEGREGREDEAKWRETRVEFISRPKERRRALERLVNYLRMLYMIHECTRQMVNTKKKTYTKKNEGKVDNDVICCGRVVQNGRYVLCD